MFLRHTTPSLFEKHRSSDILRIATRHHYRDCYKEPWIDYYMGCFTQKAVCIGRGAPAEIEYPSIVRFISNGIPK